MKFSTFVSLGLTAITALAAPTPSMIDVKRDVVKRAASLEDVATAERPLRCRPSASLPPPSRVTRLPLFSSLVLSRALATTSRSAATSPSSDRTARSCLRTSPSPSRVSRMLSFVTLPSRRSSVAMLSPSRRYELVTPKEITTYLHRLQSENVWVDHLDLSSDRDHDKDYYDGLLDITHAADFVTVTNTFLHDHWKASLIGHSDSNGAEDKGHLTVTYANNYLKNLNSRGRPSASAQATSTTTTTRTCRMVSTPARVRSCLFRTTFLSAPRRLFTRLMLDMLLSLATTSVMARTLPRRVL
uniref:Pectin lyase n=1 Tax=Peyronellaea pinodes TaxID=749589 RepID=PELA_PEYPI|nr:RecName: Full=Pectin lyase; Flags: Precursor [Didymella pinodes]CAA60884.1 pectin lyase [Didymella pinodes]